MKTTPMTEFFKTLDEEHVDRYGEFERKNQERVISNTQLSNEINIISNTQMPRQQVIRIELNPDGSVKKISKNKK